MTIGLNRINILFHYLSKKRKIKRVGKIGIRMFWGIFERPNDQCVSSLQQGYFSRDERSELKIIGAKYILY